MATDDSREPTRDPHSELLWQPGRKLDDNSFEDSSFDDETSPEAQTRPWVEPSIEQLKAYRRSELKSPERETVEDALLRSSTVRARLAALSDLEPRSAPSSTRERVLAAFDREFSNGESADGKQAHSQTTGHQARVLPWRSSRDTTAKSPASRARSLRPAWAALAAALLAVLVWMGSPSTEPLPQDLYWQIQAQGRAEVRSHPDEPVIIDAEPLQLTPTTVLRLDASPSRAIAEVDVSLFRIRSGERAQQLSLGDSTITLDRGAARIEAPTIDLLGSDPDSGWLILVLSRPGSEPSVEELEQALRPTSSGEPSEAIVTRPEWRAHPIPYVLTDS